MQFKKIKILRVSTPLNSNSFAQFFLFLKLNEISHRYLRDKFKIIDPTKICGYGWGYGAFVTSILLTKDSKRTFVCYIAVAPIVSFQFYSEYIFHSISDIWMFNLIKLSAVNSFTDSFFTEKYFGYHHMIGHSLQEADLSTHASSFVSKNYLLIHGTADTCVHQQHTMVLTKALIQKGVIFRHQVSERGKERRRH